MRINRPKQARVVERQIKYNDQCDHDDDHQFAHHIPPIRHRRICNFRTLRAAYRIPLKRVLSNFYAARPAHPSALPGRYCFTAPDALVKFETPDYPGFQQVEYSPWTQRRST